MNLDPWLLAKTSGFLLLVAFSRAATLDWKRDVWPFSVFAMTLCGGMVLMLLFAGRPFEVDVFFAALAVLLGLLWSSLTKSPSPQRAGFLAASAALALVSAALVSGAALAYSWWMPTLAVIALFTIPATRDLTNLALRSPRNLPAPSGPPARGKTVQFSRIARQDRAPLRVTCAQCATSFEASWRAMGPGLRCPQCRALNLRRS